MSVPAGSVITGEVRDVNSNEPLVGAYVALFQIGDEPGSLIPHGGRKGVCFHVDLAITDANGHYRLPAWHVREFYINRATYLIAYKPGYLLTREAKESYRPDEIVGEKVSEWKKKKRIDPVEYLRRDPNLGRQERGGIREGYGGRSLASLPLEAFEFMTLRVRQLDTWIWSDLSCENPRTLYPLRKAVYEEASSLATTDTDLRYVYSMCMGTTQKGGWRDGFGKDYSQGLAPPCDINDVPEDWKRWDAEVRAVGGGPSTARAAPAQAVPKDAELRSLHEAFALEIDVPIYPGARDLTGGESLSPLTRKQLAELKHQAASSAASRLGFRLYSTPDVISSVTRYYAKELQARKPQIMRDRSGETRILLIDEAARDSTVISLRPNNDEGGTYIAIMRARETSPVNSNR